MSPTKEQPKSNPYADIEELQDAIDFPESKPEGKVIPIHRKEKLSPEISKKLSKELSDLNKHIKDVELLKEGLALMSKRHKYYAETKEMLDLELNVQGELWERRDQLEKQLLTQSELDEMFIMRSKKMESLEADALAKVRKELGQEQHPEETALVPQSKETGMKHKDWGAWRTSLGDMETTGGGAKMFFITYPVWGFPLDLGNWTYRKIKRLMGQGAELDGEKKENEPKTVKILHETRVEKEKWRVGDKAQLKEGVHYSPQVDSAKSIEIIGVTNNTITLQLDGEKSFVYIPKEYYSECFELIPETPEEKEPKTFDLYNGGKTESTGEQEKWGLHVGQKLFFKTPSKLSEENYPEYYHAKDIRIVGFTMETVIVQFDGRKVNNITAHNIFRDFKEIPETPEEKGEPKTFVTVRGDEIKSTGAERKGNWYVGQRVRLDKDAHGVHHDLIMAKSITIDGFTEKGDFILRLDSEKIIDITKGRFRNLFAPITDTETPDDGGELLENDF